jgi:eukaryotic-like serine/threonine-protein kinase
VVEYDAEEVHVGPLGLIGQVIAGRYRVDGVLGSGGMGVVLRAHHVSLRRDVAIKILRPELSSDAELAARFEREALSLSRLEHPNCLQVTDLGRLEDGTLFMVLQLLEGWELTELLGEPVPVLQAVEITIQLLRGLEHTHRRKIVHRDLKPENVFLVRNEDGTVTVKIVDFGIAKMTAWTTDSVQTRIGAVFGTPAYMSPEQALGTEVDHRADLYATGCVLYEMLAGRAPFRHADPLVLLSMRLTTSPPPLPAEISVMVREVVAKLMIVDRELRVQSATEALHALENAAVVLRRFEGLEYGAEAEWKLPKNDASALMQDTPERTDVNAKRSTSGLVSSVSEDDLSVLRRRLDSVLHSPTMSRQLHDEGATLQPDPPGPAPAPAAGARREPPRRG